MRLAFMNSARSKDPSTKVGAVLVDADGRRTSFGYNGFPPGLLETAERYHDRSQKYPRVVHAEMNAVLNASFPVQGSTLYSSLFPCSDCLKLLAAARIRRIVYYGPKWEREGCVEAALELSQQFEITYIEPCDSIEELRDYLSKHSYNPFQ